MPTRSPVLTHNEWAAMHARAARIHFERASVEIKGRGVDARYVMEGPSGTHSLLCTATSLDRLNAHWTNFCLDPRNRYPQ